MGESLNPSVQRVQDAFTRLGMSFQVVEFPASTRTAADAAQAIGTTVGQIAKSIVFKARKSQRPVLVITSGLNRVNEKHVGDLLGETLDKADADFVRARTGFAIGGVSPVGHTEQVEILIDEDLLQYQEIWAAAGTPNAVFRLTPDALVQMTAGRVISVK